MEITPKDIASFRYSLISAVVNRKTPLLPGEIKEYFNEVSSRQHFIPGSPKTHISVRSLERYKSAYLKYGFKGLYPKPKDTSKTSDSKNSLLLDKATKLKKECPERSIEQILYLMRSNQLFERESISASTISRHFRDAGLSLLLKKVEKGYKRFEATECNIIWQFDFQHTLYLPNPQNSQKKKKALLFAILDDFSRYIVHAQFYWDEKLPRMEDSLKKAIIKHGIPEQFYCDNGPAFSSHHLKNICARMGIRLTHSRAKKPQGRGKIERFFRFIDTSFKPEAYLEIGRGTIITIEDLNSALFNWIDGYYHQKTHGTTKETPYFRMSQGKPKPCHIDLETLNRIFYWTEKRKANKTACISLSGMEYEVDSDLIGKEIELRYDPFDLNIVEVWYQGHQYANAKPLELLDPKTRWDDKKHRAKHNKQVEDISVSKEISEGTSFFNIARKQKEQYWEQSAIEYSKSLHKKEDTKNDN